MKNIIFVLYYICLPTTIFGFGLWQERLAVKSYAAGDYNEALQYYQERLNQSAYDPQLNYNVGDVLYKLGKFDDACNAFNRAAKHAQPKSQLAIQACFNMGNSYYQQERWQQAVDAYSKVLVIEKDHPSALHNLKLALRKLQENPEEKNQEKEEKQQEKDSSECKNESQEKNKSEKSEKTEKQDNKSDQSEKQDNKSGNEESQDGKDQEKKDELGSEKQDNSSQGQEKEGEQSKQDSGDQQDGQDGQGQEKNSETSEKSDTAQSEEQNQDGQQQNNQGQELDQSELEKIAEKAKGQDALGDESQQEKNVDKNNEKSNSGQEKIAEKSLPETKKPDLKNQLQGSFESKASQDERLDEYSAALMKALEDQELLIQKNAIKNKITSKTSREHGKKDW